MEIPGNDTLPHGIIPSLPTPFDQDCSIDLDGLTALVEHQIRAGVHGLAVLCAMGEVQYLLREERGPIIETVVKAAGGKVPVLVGLNAASTRQAIMQGTEAGELGATGLLVSTASAHKIPLPTLMAHFRAIAVETGLPMILDRSSALARLHASDDEVGRLLDSAGFKGLREARSRPLQDLKVHAKRSDRILLYVGNYTLLPDAMALGAAGTICPVLSLFPEEAVTMYDAAREGDNIVAHQLATQLAPIMLALFGKRFNQTITRHLLSVVRAGMPIPRVNEPVMSAIKYGLALRGVPITPRVRKPLPEVNARQRARIRAELLRLGLIKEDVPQYA
ncbi:MAG: dihydrodipicolinate synthase family protein [Deltaproteobacteria bacterium]|nr:dihydrodipicolinate synthase family protein [Deltaproteobacteria bacterium]